MVRYQPGAKNEKPDVLSRCWDLRSEEGSEDLQPVHFLFTLVQPRISVMKATQLRNPFRNPLLRITKKNKAWLATHDAVAAKREVLDPHFGIQDDVLLWKGR